MPDMRRGVHPDRIRALPWIETKVTRQPRGRDRKTDPGARSRYQNFRHRVQSGGFYSEVKVRPRPLHELFSRGWMSILQ